MANDFWGRLRLARRAFAWLAAVGLWLGAVPALAEPCNGVPTAGCCDGDTLKYCKADNTLAKANCAAFGLTPCGWSKGEQHYMCAPTDTEVPPAQFPKACPGAPSACKPDCTGKLCGDDGCGGTCGTCGTNETCEKVAGECVPNAKAPCGDIPTDGCCDGTVVKSCQDGKSLFMANCVGVLGTCAWVPPDGQGSPGHNFCTKSPAANQTGFKVCPKLACVPKCDGKTCGSDGCGGTCGTCGTSQTCDAAKGQCACKPDCAGKTCGDDGCGGTCGSCKAGEACEEKVKDICGIAKDLETLTLTCPVGSTITAIKYAEYGTITGTCPSPNIGSCNANKELDLISAACLNKQTCATTNWHSTLGDPCPNTGKSMAVIATCTATGGSGATCKCTPQCAGKTCGSDGCGGSCGSCANGQTCAADGKCATVPTVKCGVLKLYGMPATGMAALPPAGLDDLKKVATLPKGGAGLKNDGTLVVWGNYTNLKTTTAAWPKLTNFAAGGQFIVGLKPDGTVLVAVDVASNITKVPAGLTNVTAVAAGSGHAVALRGDGTVVVWDLGFYDSWKGEMAQLKGVKAITAGNSATGVVFSDGSVAVYSTYDAPMTIPAGLKVASLAVTTTHAYAVTLQGKVVAWGAADSGRLDVPAGLSGVVGVAALGAGGVALQANGKVVTWGTVGDVADATAAVGVTAIATAPNTLNWQSFAYTLACNTACGAISQIGCCEGDTLKSCDGVAVATSACAAGTCGWNATSGTFACNTAGASAPNVTYAKVCSGTCAPQCSGKACGDDGCGGQCGTCGNGQKCDAAGKCVCAPKCDGKFCGDDGCGGTCGSCPSGQKCDAVGKCVSACTPNCTGKTCGDDGCGGQCGVCLANEKCNAGKCEGDKCGGIPPEGCCAGTTLWSCFKGIKKQQTLCASYGDFCGWNGFTKYGCVSKNPGPDPSGKAPMACQNAACVPTCIKNTCVVGSGCKTTVLKCGSDTCGGSCGTCPTGSTCGADGQCCKQKCTGKTCGDDGCGGQCGTCATGSTCIAGNCYCKPNCAGKTCGPDGCGGVCGTCKAGTSCELPAGKCACTKQCNGKTCGPDGCGGVCGSCGTGQSCDNGKCIAGCKPKCDGKTCGPDGCGGSCGKCAADEICSAAKGECYFKAAPDTPKAGCCIGELAVTASAKGEGTIDCIKQGKVCGWDPATSKFACVTTNKSVDPSGKYPRKCDGFPACVPDCKYKACGSDGCGGWCGQCPAGKYCDMQAGYTCRPNECLKLPAVNCCDGNAMVYCDESGKIQTVDCVKEYGVGKVCGWQGLKYMCGSSTKDEPGGVSTKACPSLVCVPKCEGKKCGDDGCGGSCGTCPNNWLCEPDGKSCKMPCKPYCGYNNAYQCGDNGCGASCGTCAAGESCNQWRQCVPKNPCEGISGAGCCDGNTYKYCSFGKLVSETCSGSGTTGYCGWHSPYSAYQCGTDGGADPSGKAMQACPGSKACVPNCTGKACGPDGCGGWCGQCSKAGEICDTKTGQCTAACDGIPMEGCCDGNNLKICSDIKGNGDYVGTYACNSALGQCGWNANGAGAYSCNTNGAADPKGFRKKACPKPACDPDCAGKSCGDDGCGGTCGTCPNGTTCFAATGKCVSSQTAAACGNVKWEGGCDGTTAKFCSNGSLVSQQCKVDGKGECGWLPAVGGYGCGGNGADPSGTFSKQVSGATSACVASCTGKQCGADGCGGSCGSCAKGAVCQGDGQCGAPQSLLIAPQAGCCADDATLVSPVEGGAIAKACPDGSVCAFDTAAGKYGCGAIGKDGFVAQDPGGSKAKTCPACPSPSLPADGPCTFDGCGKRKGVCTAGTACDYKTGQCKQDNDGSCSGNAIKVSGGEYCGLFNAAWSCQCDAQCLQRGDCCKGFEPICGKQLFGSASCGDGKCDGLQGEACATCSTDCGSCKTPSGYGPLLLSPLRNTVAFSGTPGARVETIHDALDSLVPGDAPIPQQGLLAYLPRIGVNAGPPAAQFIAGVLSGKAINGVTNYLSTLYPSRDGVGWSTIFGNGKPSFGTLRVRTGRALPAEPSYSDRVSGGYSVAMWVRVPTTAPDTPNPLWSTSGDVTADEVCTWSRPQDSAVHLECPQLSGIPQKIVDIEAYYGSVANPLPPGGGCAKAKALGANYTCHAPSVQAYVEKECLGKSSCAPNPWELAKDPCSPPPHVPNQSTLIVRALCALKANDGGMVLSVDTKAGGNKLRFEIPGQKPLVAKTAIKDGEWKHVAVTFHPHAEARTFGVTSLYVNGELQAQTASLHQYDIRELTLGAATIPGAQASWATTVGTKVAAFADFDELFVYDRALTSAELVALYKKPDTKVLRVWPALPAAVIAQTGTWIAGSAKASALDVESPNVVNPATDKPLVAREKALGLPSGVTFRAQGQDGDLSFLNTMALLGWVRVNKATPGLPLLQLLQDGKAQLTVALSADCGDRGVQAWTDPKAKTTVDSCEHGVAEGQWAFITAARAFGQLRVYVDGHQVGAVATSGEILEGAAQGPTRGLEAGNGVDLKWAALVNKPLTHAEVVKWRGPGPVVWLDGGSFTANGKHVVRDFADFHNNASTGAVDQPWFLNYAGDPAKGPQGTGPLHLSSDGGKPWALVVPARGRFGNINGYLNRSFSFGGRVQMTADQMVVPLVAVVNEGTFQATGYFKPRLVCNRYKEGVLAKIKCRMEATALTNNGTWKKWATEERVADLAMGNTSASSSKAMDMTVWFDVAVAWDGYKPSFAFGTSQLATKGVATMPGKTAEATEIAGGVSQTEKVVPGLGVLEGTNLVLVPGGSIGTTDTTWSSVRLYARVLGPVELQRLVNAECEDIGCEAGGQTCLSSGVSGSLAVCGDCKAGNYSTASMLGGDCLAKKAFFETCELSSQCASGLCFGGRCATVGQTAACDKACATLGRTCVQTSKPYNTWSCSTTCADNYSLPEKDEATAACKWTPAGGPLDLCTEALQCSSGLCVTEPDVVYSAAINWQPECKSGTCPGYTGTDKQPLKCNTGPAWAQNGYKEGNPCPPVAAGNAVGDLKAKRCAATTVEACKAEHKTPIITAPTGLLNKALVLCPNCDATQFGGKPIWIKGWAVMEPTICRTLHLNLVKRWLSGKAQWDALDQEPTYELFGQFYFNQDTTVTPEQMSKLEKDGVGPVLVEFMRGSADTKKKLRARYGRMWLGDCARPSFEINQVPPPLVTDPKTGTVELQDWKTYTSPYFSRNINKQVCVANKFPNGTPCPPPGANVPSEQGDSFCDSGFCARDTGKCETGVGRLEVVDPADRGDDQKPKSGDLGPLGLTQQNSGSLEVRKAKLAPIAAAGAGDPPKSRKYSVAGGSGHTLGAMNEPGAEFFSLATTMVVTPAQGGEKAKGEFENSVFLMGIKLPMANEPATSCPAKIWKDGAYVPPPTGKDTCSVWEKPAEQAVPKLPGFKLCTPNPFGCKEEQVTSYSGGVKPKTVKGKGKLCWKNTTFVGPVPMLVIAEVALEACFSTGANVDSFTSAPEFQLVPEINAEFKMAGGVGAEFLKGFAEVMAGVKVVITIVNIAFPIRWGMVVANAYKNGNEAELVQDVYVAKYYRKIDLELTVLKVALSLYFEVQAFWGVAKAEFEYPLFAWEGFKFVWELSKANLQEKKIDLQKDFKPED